MARGHSGNGWLPAGCGALLVWLVLAGGVAVAATGAPIRVDASATSLIPMMHAYAVIDPIAFTQLNSGSNFSCSNPYDWSLLVAAPGAVAYSYGCWQSMLSTFNSAAQAAGMELLPRGCMSADTVRSVFLQSGRTYTVCGCLLYTSPSPRDS